MQCTFIYESPELERLLSLYFVRHSINTHPCRQCKSTWDYIKLGSLFERPSILLNTKNFFFLYFGLCFIRHWMVFLNWAWQADNLSGLSFSCQPGYRTNGQTRMKPRKANNRQHKPSIEQFPVFHTKKIFKIIIPESNCVSAGRPHPSGKMAAAAGLQ